MKVKVNEEKGIGCGSCVSLTEESKIFDFNDDGLAYATTKEISEENEKIVKTAIEYCPTQAIEETTEE